MDYRSPYDVLREYWGYDTFRMRQEHVVKSVLDGHDTLALLPTGGGKSICYQVPALCKPGICLVFSPLISLMNDQVQHLKRRGIQAELLHSGLTSREIDRILDNCSFGQVKLLYLSPERLSSERALARIIRMNVNLIAVDEAHCISQWGYDFRPAYLEIAQIRQWMPSVPVLALTATATEEVAIDIQEKLLFTNQEVFKASFARSNLSYSVLHEEDKMNKLLNILQKSPGSSIVYLRNRKSAKVCSEFLSQHDIQASYYHAGLSQDERIERESRWKSNKVRVICATNAFGMGIDKPDVRNVVHLDLPNSMEAYFQEAGRAGRDGLKAYAVALIGPADKNLMFSRFEANFPDLEYIRNLYKTLSIHFQLAAGSIVDQAFNFDLISFCESYRLEILPTLEALKVLEHAGYIVMNDSIYQPSELQVLADKDTLYRYQVKHAEEDVLLKTILRSYEGVFFNPVKISEYKLSQLLELNEDDIIFFLQGLHQAGIISYQQKTDQSKIFFRGERLKSTDLTIDQKWYDFRKNRALMQMQHIWRYVETAECRSIYMQQYFGEKDAEPCGICDLCLRRKKESELIIGKYKTRILELIERNPIELRDLVNAFSMIHKTQIIEILRHLESEKIISISHEMITRLKP